MHILESLNDGILSLFKRGASEKSGGNSLAEQLRAHISAVSDEINAFSGDDAQPGPAVFLAMAGALIGLGISAIQAVRGKWSLGTLGVDFSVLSNNIYRFLGLPSSRAFFVNQTAKDQGRESEVNRMKDEFEQKIASLEQQLKEQKERVVHAALRGTDPPLGESPSMTGS